MAQDCNHHIFGTGLSASETAINRLGLQSTVLGPHYRQLDALTVLGPSFLALTRLRIWRAPWGTACGAMVRRRYSGRECGPEALDCRPRRMIAVSGAVNVVLNRAIEADNVVSETR